MIIISFNFIYNYDSYKDTFDDFKFYVRKIKDNDSNYFKNNKLNAEKVIFYIN